MGIPDFVAELRRHVGTKALPLVGVTAVIFDDAGRVLLGHRADNGALAPVSGILEPREEPADAAVREALEEAGVHIRVTRLAWVHQLPRVTYDNGDQSDYLNLTFRADYLSGEPHPADGELLDIGWYDPSDLRELWPNHLQRVLHALPERGEARFELGG